LYLVVITVENNKVTSIASKQEERFWLAILPFL
jgi:hypothetical protein